MNIYRVKQPGKAYDTFDAMIVAAPDEATARALHPRDDVTSLDNRKLRGWTGEDRDEEWAKPEELTVELIGTANEGTPCSVLLASFCGG